MMKGYTIREKRGKRLTGPLMMVLADNIRDAAKYGAQLHGIPIKAISKSGSLIKAKDGRLYRVTED